MAHLSLRHWWKLKARNNRRGGYRAGSTIRWRSHLHCDTLEVRELLSYTFTTLDAPDSVFTQAGGINNSGQIVGTFRYTDGVDHGFLLSGGGYTTLDPPGSLNSSAEGINDTSQIVGTYDVPISPGAHGYLLSNGIYTTLDVPRAINTQAIGINHSGQIVGLFNSTLTSNHGFLLSNGSYTTLDVPGTSYTQANGINNASQIVGYYIVGGQFHGFLLNGGLYTRLDVPGSTFTRAYGINASGEIVGDYDDVNGTRHGFLLSGGEYTTIDPPTSIATIASGINDSGQIVGTYSDGVLTHGFLAVHVTTAPTVTCSVAQSLLWPPKRQLVNVGLSVTVDPLDANLHLLVYANDNASAADAAAIGPGTLQLRSERQGNGTGRVYLIVVTATNSGGTSFDVCTVAVPHDHSPRSIASVRQQAADAAAYYQEFQTTPPGYHLLGEGLEGGGAPSSGRAGKSAIPGDIFRLKPPALATPLASLDQEMTMGMADGPVPADHFVSTWASSQRDDYFVNPREESFQLTLLRLEQASSTEPNNLGLDLVLK